MGAWEIYTYGNGEFLSLIFNGVVALMGDGNFTTLMRLAGIFGLMWVAIKAALYRGPVEWSYIIWFMLIYGTLFVPKTDVVIVDRLDNNNTRVVANVPWGLGTFAGVTSRIGDWFTRGTEAVMTLPDDLKYHKNGVIFGSHLIEAASQYQITDGRFAANMSEFMRQCVFYDVLFRRYTWTDLLEAPDTWEFIKKYTSPVSRSFAYTAADGTQSIIACQEGAQGVLSADWNAEIDRAKRLYGARFNPRLNMTDAAAKLMADLPVSYDYLAGISQSAGDIIRANMMANAFRRAFGNAAASADASAAAQDFAVAQAEAQQMVTYATMGKIAAKLLIYMKNIYEGLLYGMFPFLFLVFMLPIGVKVFLAYLKNIVWLQLWAPMYAIINLLATIGAKVASSAATTLIDGTHALSLSTHSGLLHANAEVALITGFVSYSVPLLAYGLISGGNMALAQLASQIGAVAQASASQAASSAATGNINLANLGAYKTGMFKNDTNPVTEYGQGRYNDAYGATHTLARNGMHGQVNLKTDLGTDAELAEVVQFARRESLAKLDQATRTEARQYSDALSASLDQAIGLTRSTGWGVTKTDGWSEQDAAAYKDMYEHTKQLSAELQKKHGFTEEQADKIVHQAYADASVGISSDKAALGKLVGLVFGVSAKGEVGTKHVADHTEVDKVVDAYEQARKSAETDVVKSGIEALKNYASSTKVDEMERGSNDLAADLRANLQDTLREEQQWQKARTKQVQAQEEWSKVGTDSQSILANTIPEFVEDMRASGHSLALELLSDPTRSRELALVIRYWAENKFSGAFDDGGEAARHAIERATNPGYGQAGFAMGQRQETAVKVAAAEQAVEQADRENERTVAGEGAVRRGFNDNTDEVLHRPMRAGDPWSGAASNKLFAEDLGHLDAPSRQQAEDLKGRVYEETDPHAGRARMAIDSKDHQLDDDRKDATGDVEGKIGEGRQETEGLLPSKQDMPKK